MQTNTKVLWSYDEINQNNICLKVLFHKKKKNLENSGTKAGLTMRYIHHDAEFLIQMQNT